MAQKGNTVAFGEFGIQSMEPVWLTGRQIEAARRAMTRPRPARRPNLDSRVPA